MPRRFVALYFAITLLLAYPLSFAPGGRVLSLSPDTDLFLWTLAWDAHALVTRPLGIFNANIYYPQSLTLAYSENLIGSAVFAAPILWLTGNPVLAMNLVALLACVLCGIGTYLLARRLGVSVAGATVSGLVFAFAPPRFLRLDQLHLVTVQWIPFALASLHAYLQEGRRRDAWLTIFFFVLQALTSGHGAVFAGVALLVVLGSHMAASGAAIDLRRCIRDVSWQGVAIGVPMLASMAAYLAVQREMGLRRTLEDWAVPASSFLASPTHVQNALLSLFPGAKINETAGAYLFPGFLPLLLAVLAFALPSSTPAPAVARGRLRRLLADPRVCYALLALVALWLAAGPPVGIWPLVYWLPGLNFIRAPSRFMILATLGLAIVAGAGFDRLAARASRPRAMAILVAVLLVAEFTAAPLGTESYRVEIPAPDRWLATQPAPFVVAEVPLPDSRDLNRRERRQTLFMLHSMAHWQKTVHGYSGLRPPQHEQLYRQLLRFPDDESLAALQGMGVTFIVVHVDLYEPGEWPSTEARLKTFGDRLRLVFEDPSGRVYRFSRAGGAGKPGGAGRQVRRVGGG